jgi:predicted amidohydrolase
MQGRRAEATLEDVLRVTVLELPAAWGAPLTALAAADARLEGGPPTDLVLLPEASLTGYVSPDGDFDLTRFAEPLDGPTARAIAEVARRRRTHVVAPLALAEGGARFNAMVAFDPAGQLLFAYRKRHPWYPETWATPGPEPAPVVIVGGVRITVAMCFDIHFLEEEAAATLDAADLLLFPSAWVDDEDSKTPMLERLARRHRIAVANANWAPGVVRVPGQGDSLILDAQGAVLARAVGPGSGRADATVELLGGASRP